MTKDETTGDFRVSLEPVLLNVTLSAVSLAWMHEDNKLHSHVDILETPTGIVVKVSNIGL